MDPGDPPYDDAQQLIVLHLSHLQVRGQAQDASLDDDHTWVEAIEAIEEDTVELNFDELRSISEVPKGTRHLAALDSDRSADVLMIQATHRVHCHEAVLGQASQSPHPKEGEEHAAE